MIERAYDPVAAAPSLALPAAPPSETPQPPATTTATISQATVVPQNASGVGIKVPVASQGAASPTPVGPSPARTGVTLRDAVIMASQAQSSRRSAPHHGATSTHGTDFLAVVAQRRQKRRRDEDEKKDQKIRFGEARREAIRKWRARCSSVPCQES